MTDIRNGVNAGKTVTVHDTQITLNGWSGTGYTILDPESGAGAYMIGGGLDGGFTAIPGIQKILSVVGLGYVYIRLLAILGNSLPDFLNGIARSIFLLSHILNIVNLANNCNSSLITQIVIIGMTLLTVAIIGLLFVFAAPAIVGLLSLFAVGYFNSKLVSATINTSACQREY
ncbi:hypothetical protein AAJP47_01085 [Psychrobacter sp. B38]|uniref:hypothetical protein n=1 Tax=Psychrobacter sp. B38 TaxID=3143538 RepID=UPI00320C7BA6